MQLIKAMLIALVLAVAVVTVPMAAALLAPVFALAAIVFVIWFVIRLLTHSGPPDL